ncbi:MAG: hypothetical protein Q7R70_00675 [Candidatus Diapherotrites archaeon]|nr:hypothetical protein [Candidatus Diapherotrites archaeon]
MEQTTGEKKRKNSAVIFVAVVIVMFAGSTIALLFSGALNPQEPSNPNPSNPSDPQIPGLDFESKNFDAKVIEVLPELIIAGQTKETNPSKIDSEIAQIPGIRGLVNASYVGNPGATMTYKMTLSLAPNAKSSEVFASIQEKSVLMTGIQSIGTALIELPAQISVTNSDFNIDKNYTPKQKLTAAFVSVGTETGDLLSVSLKVNIANDIAGNPQVFEVSNQTALPKSFFENAIAKVTSLDRKLFAQGTMKYGNYIDENSLKSQLNFSDFKINSAIVPALGKSITFSVTAVDSNYDLNIVKDRIESANLKDLNSFEIGKGENNFTIDALANDNSDLNALENGIIRQLMESSFKKSQISIQAPESQFFLDLNLTAENSQESFDYLQGFFKPKGIAIETFQPANTDLSSVFIKDLNASLPVDSNSFQVIGKPGHSIGQDINFSMQIQVQRGKIIQVQGMES